MVDYNRYRVVWTGGPGGEGISTFYTPSASGAALAAIRTFFDSIKALVGNDITWTFPNTGDVLDLPAGGLSGSWSESSASPVAATSVSAWVAGVGARVVWETGAIVGGRRVRGSTFITGLSGGAFDVDGSLTTTTVSTLQSAADALIAAADLSIWSRTNSGISSVSTATIPDKPTWLRTRRE